MAYCKHCQMHYRVPADERQDHTCPRCNDHPDGLLRLEDDAETQRRADIEHDLRHSPCEPGHRNTAPYRTVMRQGSPVEE